ncbi:hypothetical protein TpMuguga_01g00088 [Theileria parva strain Muguga]|uniref:Uncharacterized protein n=1 Tax=Theileria parva TaxID=5875 RepID=Q4N9M6_THEPA|nr:uncharacterized protein TpMuguga_01g00088 [Theileria parva strain Muguga]EAN33332.1 hypothetical protein TpMuguga_01g00088 [Theileria parva strain Muguga]|eukprot:XP_765615.1 hypothetical protein [Theileria parva strain Muguga]
MTPITDDKNHPTDVPPENCELVTLNLNIKETTDKLEYFSRNSCREYSSYPGYIFNKVLEDDTPIWEANNINEFSKNLLVYEDSCDKYILIIPHDSNLVLLHQLKNNTWESVNTSINLNKMKMIERTGHEFVLEYYITEDCQGHKGHKLVRFDHHYYDLNNHNFKIIFNNLCDRVFYDNKVVWNYRDDPFRPYPEYLNFNLVDKTVTALLRDGSSIPLYLNDTVLKRPRDDSELENSQKRMKIDNSEQLNVCVYDYEKINSGYKMPLKLIPLDTDFIMSTNEFITICNRTGRFYGSRKGFVFNKLIENGKVFFETDDPEACTPCFSAEYVKKSNKYESGDKTSKKRRLEFFKYTRPNVDMLKFYTKNDSELSPDDYTVEYTSFMYKVTFLKDLYKIIHDGKVYWSYDNDKSYGFPTSVYFTDVDTDMKLTFSNGVEEVVDFTLELLKMYKNDEFGNKVEMDSGDYKVTKPERDQRLFTLKQGVRCIDVSYDRETIWRYNPNKGYPKSIFCDYSDCEIILRFDKFFILFEQNENSEWELSLCSIPRHLKLYTKDKNSNYVLMNEDHYKLETNLARTTLYKLKRGIMCSLVKYGDQVVWEHKEYEPYPEKVSCVLGLNSIRICSGDKYIAFESKRGLWSVKHYMFRLNKK